MDRLGYSDAAMSRLLKPFAVGLAGVGVGLGLWHLWTDHVAFHAVLGYLTAHADKINRLP